MLPPNFVRLPIIVVNILCRNISISPGVYEMNDSIVLCVSLASAIIMRSCHGLAPTMTCLSLLIGRNDHVYKAVLYNDEHHHNT